MDVRERLAVGDVEGLAPHQHDEQHDAQRRRVRVVLEPNVNPNPDPERRAAPHRASRRPGAESSSRWMHASDSLSAMLKGLRPTSMMKSTTPSDGACALF